jgi:catechol 2,3-dioxygenase-like lactoylglutathione lyase family enzyme
MKPVPTHLAESALYVDDLERAINFYTTLFGLPVLRRNERFCALRITADQVLLLFLRGASFMPTPLPGGVVPPHDGNGPLHVCFGIAEDAVSAWENHLREEGIPIESRVHWPSGAISLYFRDPDHHAVELATPGVFSDE